MTTKKDLWLRIIELENEISDLKDSKDDSEISKKLCDYFGKLTYGESRKNKRVTVQVSVTYLGDSSGDTYVYSYVDTTKPLPYYPEEGHAE